MRNKNLLLLLLLAVAGFSIWYFWHIVIYIIIAGIFALIGQPIDRLYRKYLRFGNFKLPATLSAGLAFLSLFFLFFLLAIFFVPLVMDETMIISSLDRNTIIASLQKPIDGIENTLRNFNIDFDSVNLQTYLQDKLMSILTVTNLSLFFNQLIGALGDFFIAFFAISFLASSKTESIISGP
ncbi:MAG: hypothetical protein AABZ32_03710 [Bacteroidota bacterium]